MRELSKRTFSWLPNLRRLGTFTENPRQIHGKFTTPCYGRFSLHRCGKFTENSRQIHGKFTTRKIHDKFTEHSRQIHGQKTKNHGKFTTRLFACAQYLPHRCVHCSWIPVILHLCHQFELWMTYTWKHDEEERTTPTTPPSPPPPTRTQ